MKVLKIVLMVLLIAIAGVLALAATRPDHYHVERSATIGAAPAVVFAQVNDLRRWDDWSPWAKLDPAMKLTYTGPESGKDASYAWAGNDKVGEGRMTITESEPDAHVGLRLEFIKPWTETCQSDFALASTGDATNVTWGIDGTHTYVSKIFCVFMDMDKMIGTDFEKGLAQLKTAAEGSQSAAASDPGAATPPAGGGK